MRLKGLLFRALLFVGAVLAPVTADGTTYVVFRYDDLAADKPGFRGTDPVALRIWQAEKAVDALFEEYGIPYVIAVIPKGAGLYGRRDTNTELLPFSTDLEKTEFVKRAIRASRVEVAQHGYAHINHAKKNHKAAEFRERNHEDQLKDISQGKNILCESLDLTNITTFVPPFNTWDNNTAKALKAAGFAVLSADRSHYYRSVIGLTVIPFTAQLWELESIAEQGDLPDDKIIVVLYHPPQIAKLEGKQHRFFGIKRFNKLLDRLATESHVKVVTLQQLAQECDSLTTDRYRTANALWRQRSLWAKLLPQHLWAGESNRPVYLATEAYATELMRWRLLTMALVTGLVLTGYTLRYVLKLLLSAKWHRRIDMAASVVCCAAVISEIHLVYRGYHPTAIRAIPAILTVSFFVALILRTIRKCGATGAVGWIPRPFQIIRSRRQTA